MLDYIHAVYDNFPYVLALIALLTFVLLVRAFRSLLLPLKAVLLNLLSLAATFGATVLFWQEGHGSDAVFGIAPTGRGHVLAAAADLRVPVRAVDGLRGLHPGPHARGVRRDAATPTQAVVEGLGRTGRLVTCAALILFLAFAALASAPGTDIKVFATALGVGILLDATIVRALLVPALVSLFGRWNWWLPSWAARLLRVAAARGHPGARASPSASWSAPTTEYAQNRAFRRLTSTPGYRHHAGLHHRLLRFVSPVVPIAVVAPGKSSSSRWRAVVGARVRVAVHQDATTFARPEWGCCSFPWRPSP